MLSLKIVEVSREEEGGLLEYGSAAQDEMTVSRVIRVAGLIKV